MLRLLRSSGFSEPCSLSLPFSLKYIENSPVNFIGFHSAWSTEAADTGTVVSKGFFSIVIPSFILMKIFYSVCQTCTGANQMRGRKLLVLVGDREYLGEAEACLASCAAQILQQLKPNCW